MKKQQAIRQQLAEAQELLVKIGMSMNELPNQRLCGNPYKNTYQIAQEIDDYKRKYFNKATH